MSIDVDVSESYLSTILHTFDTFLELLENPSIDKRDTKENLTKTFECALFVEATVAKAYNEKMEDTLEKYLSRHWLEKKRSRIYKCSDLKYACDKLLEIYMKDTSVSATVVDDLLKLYTRSFEIDRLNTFLLRTLRNSICANIILKSVKDLGVPVSKVEDEALIVSWEIDMENGRRMEVLQKITTLLEDGYISKIINLVTNLSDKSEIKKLIVQCLSCKVVENDVLFFLALIELEEKLILKLLNDESEFCIYFIDAIFYFGRNMSKINGEWILNATFNYTHLLKIVKILLNGSVLVQKTLHSRIQLAKVQPDCTIWHDIEKDILQG